eukprot:Platyproteum_vivax@DN7659_c1_g1_i23.p1
MWCEGGDVVKSLTRQEFHQGSETQGYSSIQKAFTAHGLKELQNTVAKLGEAVQTLTRAQSEKELRFDNPQIAQCLKACIPSVKWNENGNVQKIEIQGKWHNPAELLHSPATKTDLGQMWAAMRMCKTWPKTLDFRRTGLNASLAKEVADIINEHPTGFETLDFWDQPKLKNDGFRAIVDNLDTCALQNVKTIRLHCGLRGQKGGRIIHTFLEKCGNSLEFLDIKEGLGRTGVVAAFRPFQDSTRIIQIDLLVLQDTGVSKQEVQNMLKNCQVTNLHVW